MNKLLFVVSFLTASAWAESPVSVTVEWSKTTVTSRTTPSMVVVPNPLYRADSPIHSQVFAAIKELGADYVRYMPYFTYPKLSVAELEPPKDGKTSWDFSRIDPMTVDFFKATEGHSVSLNMTEPAWMYEPVRPTPYSVDPNKVDWYYAPFLIPEPRWGTELRDPTGKQLAEYYARVVSWYTKGGFTDEVGKTHTSGHHFEIPYWEVLNEMEHHQTAPIYTIQYDAIVSALREVSPKLRFVGLSLADYSAPAFFEYFLDPKNHKPDIPIDMIAYHFYTHPAASETPDHWQYTFFKEADGFLTRVRFIEAIRKRLSAQTRVAVNETGAMLPTDVAAQFYNGPAQPPIPPEYWNLSGALYAYLYVELAKLEIDVVSACQLVGYPPDMFPSVSMMNWITGKPNARYRVLELIKNNLGPGDKLISTSSSSGADEPSVSAQAFLTSKGKKVLLINRRNQAVDLDLNSVGTAGNAQVVDMDTAENPPRLETVKKGRMKLKPFAVAVISLE